MPRGVSSTALASSGFPDSRARIATSKTNPYPWVLPVTGTALGIRTGAAFARVDFRIEGALKREPATEARYGD